MGILYDGTGLRPKPKKKRRKRKTSENTDSTTLDTNTEDTAGSRAGDSDSKENS